jgi:flagellar biosynthesis/type III secretory pathway protein FliH
MHNLSPFDNELIKHNLREERDDIHQIKIRVHHKVYKQVFNQLYATIMLRPAKTRVNPHT